MDPLETLLRPATRILNRNIQEMTAARELSARLAGQVVAIRVSDTALAMYFSIEQDAIRLSQQTDVEPDIVISGSLLTLARVASGDEQTIHDVSLQLVGDAGDAQAFQKLLSYVKPDVEEELASVIGDTAAHGLGQAARRVRDWARAAGSTMGGNLREYLQEESRDVPSRYEVERFERDVNRLRDDVDRLGARIDRLRDGD